MKSMAIMLYNFMAEKFVTVLLLSLAGEYVLDTHVNTHGVHREGKFPHVYLAEFLLPTN